MQNITDEDFKLLNSELSDLRERLSKYELGWPPGHFYSPLPDLEIVKKTEHKIWKELNNEVKGIDLREKQQLELLRNISHYYHQQPWQDEKKDDLRYYFFNPNFTYGESLILFGMIMHLKPKNIIEIGSGYSSCVTLDTNELFFNNSISLTFIEPYTELLISLLKQGDRDTISIIESDLQDVDTNIYSSLKNGDILFIDSTHVAKIGSDVNHIFFEILPQLNSGVYIHFHDIYFPFEYPKNWVYQGRAWNEAYLLRAFLQNNDQFEIVLFNSFIGNFHKPMLEQIMPLAAKTPGSSIWLRKK